MEEKFRSVLLGGYNKTDVSNYIQAMENSIQSIKKRYDNEIEELKQQLEGVKKEKADLESNTESINLKVNDESAKTEQLERQLEEARKTIEELQKVENAEIKYRALEKEVIRLKEQKKAYEDDFFAISKVLKDARESAQSIEREARKKAQDILEQAEREGKDIIEQRKRQLDKELEEKGIHLMAAKYKIEAYREEMNVTQQKIYNLYLDLGKLLEGMPKCLEQLWDGDEYLPVTEQYISKVRTDD